MPDKFIGVAQGLVGKYGIVADDHGSSEPLLEALDLGVHDAAALQRGVRHLPLVCCVHGAQPEGNAVMIKAKTAARNPESLRLKGEGHPAHTYNAKHVLRGATIT